MLGTMDAFKAYAAVRERGRHLEPKPGDRISLRGVDVRVVSSALSVLGKASIHLERSQLGLYHASRIPPKIPMRIHAPPVSLSSSVNFDFSMWAI